jgi:hypothetical protein
MSSLSRCTAIRPSPYDDVTRAPNFDGGYNQVLVRYGDYLSQLAKQQGIDVADLNASVTAALAKAKTLDPEGSVNWRGPRPPRRRRASSHGGGAPPRPGTLRPWSAQWKSTPPSGARQG